MSQPGISERYLVEREIGRGGMATVYLARDLRHDRPVALKVLRPALALDLGVERFLREIHLAAQLHHPHILPLYDSGTLDAGEGPRGPFYVMPYIEGESLRARLEREGPLPAVSALRIALEVADALDYAHRQGIIHRDVKPENILLEDDHALVADFGIARALSLAGEATITATGSGVGTPAYMSPEQAVGDPRLDGRSDVYSLACVVFEMLCGAPPFTARSVAALLARRLTEPPPRLRSRWPDAPEALDSALDRALSREAVERFPTALAFARALGGPPAGSGSTPATRAPTTPLQPDRPSVGVLPFVNMSSDPENEYFSDGITEEIINALARVRTLRVAARTSAFAFKGKSADAREIGERLKVDTLLEGSVRKAGDRIRISAQLINVADGYQLWSERYERTLADIFAVQDELARAIAGALTRTVITGTPLPPATTGSLEAYTLSLRGRYFLNRRTAQDLHTAIGYFEQAVAKDPKSVPALTGLAAAWALRGFEEYGELEPQAAMPRARAAAERALELDPHAADAHLWLAVVDTLFDWDWEAAEARLRETLRLAPEHSVACVWLAMVLGLTGRHEESIAVARRAEELDPVSLVAHLSVARCFAFAGWHGEALSHLDVILEMEPRLVMAHLWRSRVYVNQGHYAAALQAVTTAIELGGRTPILLAQAGYVRGRLGQVDEARALLAALRTDFPDRYVSPMHEAAVAAGLGELDEVFRLYEQAIVKRSGYVAFLRVEPGPESPARADPRFQALLERLHLDG